ncbi:hypothetical protein [Ornithinibacillus sp. 179-J 7C1 HS]|uniref:hypothetical protein n=1 Tax=Ornithinibacillus sp. 179-J 7C1 HS TaxID=3142384 RepID=UPI0039A36110
MGYILPIQQHDHTDYQRRIITNKRTITSVEKPYKLVFKTKYEDLKHQEETRNQKVDLHLNQVESSITNLINIDQIFSEITGVGQIINERV